MHFFSLKKFSLTSSPSLCALSTVALLRQTPAPPVANQKLTTLLGFFFLFLFDVFLWSMTCSGSDTEVLPRYHSLDGSLEERRRERAPTFT